MTDATNPRRFDIALSFPGEHRDFVFNVAEQLGAKLGRQRILYDKYHEAEFARPNLDTHLPNLYRTESELIAVFLCAEYSRKRWCNLEWRFIRQLIATTEEDRIMFLSFDEIGAVPEIGILSGDGYVAISGRSSNEIAGLILQRLGSRSVRASHRDGVFVNVNKPVVITVLLPDDHKTFGQDKADNLRSILAHEAGVDPDQIVILRTRTGSIQVDIELSEEAAKRLLVKCATGQGVLRDRGVIRIDAELPQEGGAKAVSVRMLRTVPWALVGRELELAQLDRIAVGGGVNVLTLVALGGEGKTSLVAAWMSRLAAVDWGGFDMVFDWSFYSQGTREQLTASSDRFLKDALNFFGDDADKQFAVDAAAGFEKGQRLARLVGRRRSLLILDGLEALQYAPTSPTPGELKDQGIAALLKGLAANSHGLCVVTTRYALPDLRGNTVHEEKLTRLSTLAGVALLQSLGVNGSLRKTIPSADGRTLWNEYEKLVEDVKGHALTLNLLGSYLRDAHAGDIRRRNLIKLEEADAEEQGGHAFHVMDAYVRSFESGGKNAEDQAKGRRALALLQLLGLFDRPATADCLKALWQSPAIAGLTEPLIGLSEAQRNLSVKRLEDARLLTVNRVEGSGELISLDAHPLLREYFARRVREQLPEAWRAAHRRLYEHLFATTNEGYEPTLEDLQPLYQAVAHGCQAGLQQEACNKVYYARILRGREDYSVYKLGAFSADLGALACFFESPWNRASVTLTEVDQAWLLNQAAFRLRALGRLNESLEPMRAALEMGIKQANWEECSIRASNLSGLELTLGAVAGALRDAEQSVIYADRSNDKLLKMIGRAKLADVLHQAGRRVEAEVRFNQAEGVYAESQLENPLMYSGSGFRYCDLLLAEPERAAWQTRNAERGMRNAELIEECRAVIERAAQALKIAEQRLGLLDIALNQLTLGRATLYAAILENSDFRPLSSDFSDIDAAVSGLRRAGHQDYLPLGLFTRAWLRSLTGERTGPESAQSDLDEAWEIAERGPMRLFMADIHLYRARLFGLQNADSGLRNEEAEGGVRNEAAEPYPWESPQADLAAAEKLINDCGYHRRDEELTDAKKAILGREL